MNDIHNQLKHLRIIPVVTLQDAEDAIPLAETLVEAGLPVVEITFRTSAAAAGIRKLSRREDLLVGAGTVLTVDQAKAAVEAGARFVVSPGFNPSVVDHCRQASVFHVPGVCTPTEIEAALQRGLRVLKFFPAEAVGGVALLRAISRPYPAVDFIPTGGIQQHNLADYLRLPQVLACGGSWIAASPLIAGGRFAKIRENVLAALRVVAELAATAHPAQETP